MFFKALEIDEDEMETTKELNRTTDRVVGVPERGYGMRLLNDTCVTVLGTTL